MFLGFSHQGYYSSGCAKGSGFLPTLCSADAHSHAWIQTRDHLPDLTTLKNEMDSPEKLDKNSLVGRFLPPL